MEEESDGDETLDEEEEVVIRLEKFHKGKRSQSGSRVQKGSKGKLRSHHKVDSKKDLLLNLPEKFPSTNLVTSPSFIFQLPPVQLQDGVELKALRGQELEALYTKSSTGEDGVDLPGKNPGNNNLKSQSSSKKLNKTGESLPGSPSSPKTLSTSWENPDLNHPHNPQHVTKDYEEVLERISHISKAYDKLRSSHKLVSATLRLATSSNNKTSKRKGTTISRKSGSGPPSKPRPQTQPAGGGSGGSPVSRDVEIRRTRMGRLESIFPYQAFVTSSNVNRINWNYPYGTLSINSVASILPVMNFHRDAVNVVNFSHFVMLYNVISFLRLCPNLQSITFSNIRLDSHFMSVRKRKYNILCSTLEHVSITATHLQHVLCVHEYSLLTFFQESVQTPNLQTFCFKGINSMGKATAGSAAPPPEDPPSPGKAKTSNNSLTRSPSPSPSGSSYMPSYLKSGSSLNTSSRRKLGKDGVNSGAGNQSYSKTGSDNEEDNEDEQRKKASATAIAASVAPSGAVKKKPRFNPLVVTLFLIKNKDNLRNFTCGGLGCVLCDPHSPMTFVTGPSTSFPQLESLILDVDTKGIDRVLTAQRSRLKELTCRGFTQDITSAFNRIICECIDRNRKTLTRISIHPCVISQDLNIQLYALSCEAFHRCHNLEKLYLNVTVANTEKAERKPCGTIIQMNTLPSNNLVELELRTLSFDYPELQSLAENIPKFQKLKRLHLSSCLKHMYVVEVAWVGALAALPEIESMEFYGGRIGNGDLQEALGEKDFNLRSTDSRVCIFKGDPYGF